MIVVAVAIAVWGLSVIEVAVHRARHRRALAQPVEVWPVVPDPGPHLAPETPDDVDAERDLGADSYANLPPLPKWKGSVAAPVRHRGLREL